MNAICGIYSPNGRHQAISACLERMLSSLDPLGRGALSFFDREAGLALGQVQRGTEPESLGQGSAWHEGDTTVAALDGFVVAAPAEKGLKPEAARTVVSCLEADAARFPLGLDGHFGLATWSRRGRILRLARDPLGAKTLYWFQNPGTGLWVFSSELTGILAHPALPRRIDPEALTSLMAFGYVPAPLCLFAGVHKLLPGEVVEVEGVGPARTRRYWSVPPYAPRQAESDEFAGHARRLLLERFERYLEGHERVGVFLSGGVDSTVALGILKLLGVPGSRAFALGVRIGEPRLAEDLAWAERAADAVGIPCQRLVIERGHDPVPALTRVWRHFDDPVLSPNVHTRFLLAEAARAAGARVCVSGTTAGSMFGTVSDASVAKLQRRIGEEAPLALLAYRTNRIFPYDEIRDLLVEPTDSPRRTGLRLVERYAEGIDAASLGDWLNLAKMLMTGTEKSVATQERSARLSGVEMRQAFRDVALLEFCRTIPIELKGRHGSEKSKHIIKLAFRDVLPSEIATRKQIGYPSYYWRNGEIDGLAQVLLSRRAVERVGLFRPDRVAQILDEDRGSQKRSAGKRTWALLTMQAWHALHVEGREHLV